MAYDSMRNRLIVAEFENNTVGIVDLQGRKVIHVIAGLAEPQGVGYEPASDTLYVANAGDGSVRLFRAGDVGRQIHTDVIGIIAQFDAAGLGSNAIMVLDGLTGQHTATWLS
jgi:DNA-binding beta-propeller fold protein YncE